MKCWCCTMSVTSSMAKSAAFVFEFTGDGKRSSMLGELQEVGHFDGDGEFESARHIV